MQTTGIAPRGLAGCRLPSAVGGIVFLSFLVPSVLQAQPIVVESPGKVLAVAFELQDGAPTYRVSRLGRAVIEPSKLGFQLRGDRSLDRGFKVASTTRARLDETWTQVWGEQQKIRNHYNELGIELEATDGDPRGRGITFRVFDDGIGFRYHIPSTPGMQQIEIADELTQFAFTGDHRAWWIPAVQPNRYEYRYTDSPLSRTTKVHTPVTFETKDSLYLSIHEAALTDFASMALWRKEGNTFEADLVPWSDGIKVRRAVPMTSPWRTIQIADTPGGLIDNYLILNLNEPNKLEDVSWIEPGKYVGIWWAMHLGTATWSSGPKHGATTENTKRYLDFAARHGFDGVLVEGWNVGWDGDWTANGGNFSFTQPYPDYDLPALADYARQRGVRLIGHHETSGGVENYERQMDDAFALCQKLGIRAVKTGYVTYGPGIQRTTEDGSRQGEWSHGQYMVRHFRQAVETAAQHQVMIFAHEPIKDTGIRRTYPNMMSREGACGQEYNAWGGDNRNYPDHTTILPFTRMLAGPMDFTPGIFDLLFEEARPGERVSTTLAKQLALYVVIYSPWQMAADLPENYEAKPEPFAFIKEVPTDWAETEVLHARIGDYVTIARKDRQSDDWYLGSITDENGRLLKANLNFLDPSRRYVAEVYRDGDDADWDTNPYAMTIERKQVTSITRLPLRLAPGGGTAIRFRPATKGGAPPGTE
ncbi:MAG: glycoside hydrolase family 97 protein [bacterium]|nr:glycoside hydrolase family 97 protein [bacterium]